MKTVYGAVITCLTSHCQCQSAGRPRAHKYTLSHSRAHNTHTAWYVWNESSSIMKPLAQAWPVLALSAMAVTIFCQHWLRLLSSWLHAKEFHAQSFPPLLLNKELNSAPKQIKWVYWGEGGGKNVARRQVLFHRLLLRSNFGKMFFGRWKVGEGTRGVGGCWGLDPWWDLKSSRGTWSEWDPHKDGHLWGCMSPPAPGTFNFVESEKKEKKKRSHLKEKTAVGFSATLPVFQHWALEL